MAIIKKVKDWLGIEGVKIALLTEDTFDPDKNTVFGSYSINTQSNQYIESIRLLIKEKYIRGRRKSKLIDEYTIGELIIPINKEILPDQVIASEFELAFKPLKSAMDRFGDKNFLYKGVSSLAKLLKNAKSKYTLIAEVSVKGNKLKPYDKVELVAK